MHELSRLADAVHRLTFDAIPEGVVRHALLVIRDLLGATLAATRSPEIQGLQRLAASLSAAGHSTLIGATVRVRSEFAAWVNATAAGTLELTEGNQFALNHPAMHILPAALAVAEEEGASGRELLLAFILGYEVAARVGRATRLRHAVHPFGTTAIVGVAAAVARLRGFSAKKILESMEIAAGMASASSQGAANAGASVRNLAIGMANYHGVLASGLIQAGFMGEPGALGSVFGHIVGDRFDPAQLDQSLPGEWLLTRNYFKIYACSRWNHAPIEATIAALEGRTLAPEDVEGVTVWTYYPATRLQGREPANGYAAKHSIPFNVAVRIAAGTNDLGAYSDRYVFDPAIRGLTARVAVEEDPAFTALVPELRAARVEIRTRAGKTFVASVERPRGGFDNPFDREILDRKFRNLAAVILRPEEIDLLERRIWTLPQLERVALLGDALKSGTAPV
jgi:2-methylcitrate dehydratase PrpD